MTVRRCRESGTGGIPVGVVRAEAGLFVEEGVFMPARRFSKPLTPLYPKNTPAESQQTTVQ